MAKQRYIKDSIWSDNWFSNIDPIEKSLWLYLLTNEKLGICGLYELPLKKIAYETGIDRDMVTKIFERFEQDGKCFYREGRILLVNFFKHLGVNTIEDNLRKGVKRELEAIPQDVTKLFSSEAIIVKTLQDTYKGLQGAYKVVGILYFTSLHFTSPIGDNNSPEQKPKRGGGKIIKKEEFFEKIKPKIEEYKKEGFDLKDLDREASDCWLHFNDPNNPRGGIKIATTTYSNWIKTAKKYGNIKAKPQTVYEN